MLMNSSSDKTCKSGESDWLMSEASDEDVMMSGNNDAFDSDANALISTSSPVSQHDALSMFRPQRA